MKKIINNITYTINIKNILQTTSTIIIDKNSPNLYKTRKGVFLPYK